MRLLFFILAICSITHADQQLSGRKTTLVVFGASFCGVCKREFPETQQAISALSPEKRANLTVKLYVTAGNPSSVRPTEAMANEYRAHYLPMAIGIPDPWRWLTFKRYFPGTNLAIPAGVVEDDETHTILKRFYPGNFIGIEVVNYLKSIL